jgi:hypothetical protein
MNIVLILSTHLAETIGRVLYIGTEGYYYNMSTCLEFMIRYKSTQSYL